MAEQTLRTTLSQMWRRFPVMRSLSIDIETYSGTDLAKSGVYRYSESPDFEVLLFGYSIDGGAVRVIDLASGETLPPEIREALTDDSVTKWAHNAQFERVCLSRYLGKWLEPVSWRCTMVWSASGILSSSLFLLLRVQHACNCKGHIHSDCVARLFVEL